MAHADKVTSEEAMIIAKLEYGVSVTLKTMHNWCEGRGIGVKIAGRWYVNTKRLRWLLEGMEWKIKKDEQEKQKQK